MPLKIIIVGGGIGGLTAAIALRYAGHHVSIYERSSRGSVFGAAIHVTPNAMRSLLAWGLDPIRARLVKVRHTTRVDGVTLETLADIDETEVEEKFGAPWYFCHRVDLNDELRRLATRADGEGEPAIVYWDSKVVGYTPGCGSITLSDGSVAAGDLVIAADGLHSRAIKAISGADIPTQEAADISYRFQIKTADLLSNPQTAQFLEDDDGRMKFFHDANNHVFLVWYPCRNNELHSFNAFLLTNDSHTGTQAEIDKSILLKQLADFHSILCDAVDKATNTKKWPLLCREPLRSWYKGKLVLIGDGAHAMTPYQGQGGAMAVEDAVALGIVLTRCPSDPKEIPRRLRLFQEIRINRATTMQLLGNVGQDPFEASHYQNFQMSAAKYDIGHEDLPRDRKELGEFKFGYDVVAHSVRVMKRDFEGWELPERFFEKALGKGTFPLRDK